VTVRRFIAVDDCGVRINPMIVDGQIHGGLAEGIGIALMEVITFDEEGNCIGANFLDYLLPLYEREHKSYLSIGIGCTGGRHRSVYVAEQLAKMLKERGLPVRVSHRDATRE